MDEGGLRGKLFLPESFCQIHERFYEPLSDAMKTVIDPVSNKAVKITPGAFRQHDVKVGQHIAISAGAVPRFLNHFVDVYGHLGKMECLIYKFN